MMSEIHGSHDLYTCTDEEGDWPECVDCYACLCCSPAKLAAACKGFDEGVLDA